MITRAKKTILLACVVAGAVVASTGALAGTGINGIFNLGVENTVDAQTLLRGSAGNPQLKVNNQLGSDAAIGLLGVHSAAAGKGAGVQGETASAAAGANGVVGAAQSPSAAGDSNGVKGVNNGAGRGVYGQGSSGPGVYGNSKTGYGVWGIGTYGLVGGGSQGGVWASTGNGSGSGVYGENTNGSATGAGVFGRVTSVSSAPGSAGVSGENKGNGNGVRGDSAKGYGVYGTGKFGLVGGGTDSGVWASTANGAGSGVYGQNTSGGKGVFGKSTGGAGVVGSSDGFDGVYGETKSSSFAGVSGHGGKFGVWGLGSTGVYGQSNAGGFAFQANGNATQSLGWGGWVKAMLYWDPHRDNHIVRCYNSQLPPQQAAVPPCGFQALSLSTGLSPVDVNFGFRVTYRFVMVTPVQDGGDIGADIEDATDFRSDTWIRVNLFYSSVRGYQNGSKRTNAPFYLVVL